MSGPGLERVIDKWIPIIGQMTRLNKELECGFGPIRPHSKGDTEMIDFTPSKNKIRQALIGITHATQAVFAGLRFLSASAQSVKLTTALCTLIISATAAQAVPIRSLPNLQGLSIFEASGVITFFNMTPNGSVVTTRRNDRLSFSNSDFQSNASEFYDFFYSDADGTFNIDGAFLSITAIFDNPTDSGLNISRARLNFTDNSTEFASVVSSFVALGSFPFPSTVDRALGDTPGTTTFLGDTFGQPDNVRLRLTLGFESTAVQVVPVPAALPLFGSALAVLGFVGWIRKRRSIAG